MNSLEKQSFYVKSLPSEWKSLDRNVESIHISFNDIPTTNPIAHWFPARISHYKSDRPQFRFDITAWVMIEFAARIGSKSVVYFASVIDRDGNVWKYEGVRVDKSEQVDPETNVGGYSSEAEAEEPSYPERVVPTRPSYSGPMVLRKGDRIRLRYSSPYNPS